MVWREVSSYQQILPSCSTYRPVSLEIICNRFSIGKIRIHVVTFQIDDDDDDDDA